MYAIVYSKRVGLYETQLEIRLVSFFSIYMKTNALCKRKIKIIYGIRFLKM